MRFRAKVANDIVSLYQTMSVKAYILSLFMKHGHVMIGTLPCAQAAIRFRFSFDGLCTIIVIY